MAVTLDDTTFAHLYVPPGILHGFQALTEQTDICYRIDREHAPDEDLSVRYDDPQLGIAWPLPVAVISDKDLAAGSWSDLMSTLGLPAQRVAGNAADPIESVESLTAG
jgi:dTDP-4-dehydrorhamnose 3,5-epimerase